MFYVNRFVPVLCMSSALTPTPPGTPVLLPFLSESPDPATIPPTDLVGVTVTLITCCYKDKEFIRVGYYVNNEHSDPAINAEIQVCREFVNLLRRTRAESQARNLQ